MGIRICCCASCAQAQSHPNPNATHRAQYKRFFMIFAIHAILECIKHWICCIRDLSHACCRADSISKWAFLLLLLLPRFIFNDLAFWHTFSRAAYLSRRSWYTICCLLHAFAIDNIYIEWNECDRLSPCEYYNVVVQIGSVLCIGQLCVSASWGGWRCAPLCRSTSMNSEIVCHMKRLLIIKGLQPEMKDTHKTRSFRRMMMMLFVCFVVFVEYSMELHSITFDICLLFYVN